jgi:hypothetical protein
VRPELRARGLWRGWRSFAASALLGASIACLSAGPVPEPLTGSVPVSPAASLAFYMQASEFYQGLVQRRFNTLETFNDPLLRNQFQTESRFFDYYADLANSLNEADFERSRPVAAEVQDFIFENPWLVHVQVRFVGEDDRPLRPNKTSLGRLDRWERVDDRWFLAPEKL